MLPTVCTPTHATLWSIGLDLYSLVSVIIPPHDKVLINTGVAFKIPMGYYGQVAPCSGWPCITISMLVLESSIQTI